MDIEHVARDYLRSKGYDAQFHNPATVTGGLVTVERLSGRSPSPFLRRCVLGVECWGGTRGEAAALADAVYHDLLAGLSWADDAIAGVSPDMDPYRFDDPDYAGRLSRYECSLTVTMNS